MPERVARYMAGWDNISLNGRALAFSLLLAWRRAWFPALRRRWRRCA